MAVRCLCPQIIVQGSSMKKPLNKAFMIHKNQFIPSNNKTSKLQIRSSINNKVFEDQARGIICYKDENGEIICEGYDDEGPRFHEPDSRLAYNQKEIEIIEMLRRSCFQIAEEDGLNHGEKGVAAMEDFDWNGFIRYYC